MTKLNDDHAGEVPLDESGVESPLHDKVGADPVGAAGVGTAGTETAGTDPAGGIGTETAGTDPAGGTADGVDDGAAESVIHDIDTLLSERDSFKDIALRLQADFENYRKRVATQQADEIDRATGRIADSLLPVLDACEAAFSHGVQGVEPVWSALIGALQKHGLEALDLAGQPFDPAVAEAVMHEPGEGGEPVVADVMRTGYRWKGRVLRPAMVKVRG